MAPRPSASKAREPERKVMNVELLIAGAAACAAAPALTSPSNMNIG